MPTTPKEDKRFLDLLIEKRTLPFEEALAVFANKQGKVNRSSVITALNALWVENTFSLLGKTGEEASWIDDAPFESPAEYTLRFNGIAGKENTFASRFSDFIDPQGIAEIAPGYVWATVKRQEPLGIVGEQAGATVLAERIRAFTHQFAFQLATGHAERIAGLFSSRAANSQTVETLLTRLAHLEKAFGPFDSFDHVEVVSVYNGDVANIDASAHMKLPKSIRRNEQRGCSRFQLISVRTPNGMFLHEYTVALNIIEEDGFFRIFDAYAYSGY
jgi:hypothetical protein